MTPTGSGERSGSPGAVRARHAAGHQEDRFSSQVVVLATPATPPEQPVYLVRDVTAGQICRGRRRRPLRTTRDGPGRTTVEAASEDAEASAQRLLARAREVAAGPGADDRETALRLARRAGRIASAAGLADVFLEALHAQVRLEDGPLEQIPAALRALDIVGRYPGVAARRWEAAILDVLGNAQVDADRLPDAVASFRAALALRQHAGSPAELEAARHQVAWATHLLGALHHPSP